MRTSTKGFSLPLLITIIVAVGVVGLIAWRIYAANQPTQSDSTQQSQTGQQQTTDPNQGYLVISEWGVRIKLDDSTKDVTYSVAQSSGDEAVYIIDPGMKALDVQQCPGNATPGMIGLLDRSKDLNHWGEKAIEVDNENAFKIGAYYYLFRKPQAECSQNSDTAEKRGDRIRDFLNVLKTISSQ